ncbi:pilus assembly protein PilV [Variovorax sp. OV329]|uniref:pilus assembly protein PilV n=1 Tax=Variovorax sp. OV329 TaxID=1882825 RepID=UPI0020C83FC6|nr:pilus assembly protein PilV [Variovorax sp. OV329]
MSAIATHRPVTSRASHARAHIRGMALLEVLVALLIFMLGLLGLIGLHGVMTATQTDSKIRADAAYLATEAVGRMWSDMNNLTGYAGDANCSAASCTEWRAKVAKILPSGGAAITVDEASGDVSITLTWTTPKGGSHKYQTLTTILSKAAG